MSRNGGGRPENAAAAAFQDAALGVEFKWKARDDKLKKQGLNPDDVSKEQEAQRAAELRREIEKLKQQRQKRDEERAALLESRSGFAGDSLVSHVDEDKFLFLQLNRRALIRLNEGRPKHIDWLILIYLHAAGLDSLAAIEANTHAQHEQLPLPRLPSDALTPQDVLLMISTPSDSASILQHQHQQQSIAWQLLSYQHRKSEPPSSSSSSSSSHTTDARLIQSALQQVEKLKSDVELFLDLEGVHFSPGPQVEGYWRAVLALLHYNETLLRTHQGPVSSLSLSLPNDDTTALFIGKSYHELVEQERLAKEAMSTGVLIDDDYWQTALSRLALFKADARLAEIFQTAIRHSMPAAPNIAPEAVAVSTTSRTVPTASVRAEAAADPGASADGAYDGQPPSAKRRKLGEDEIARSIEETFIKDAESNMENGEEVFDSEVNVASKHVAWMDKYRPRKPKYFNRVKTGYEWNKYNQTHYGPDNPPPKIVQGYKFNIFYPDLIDKSKTPQYFLEKSDSPDFVILRFHAGPPYEDIAFKIVNKEWEQSQKHGFKCQFSHGILYLWFNFKRYRYRR